MTSIYDFEVTTIDGRRQKLDEYRGRALLIVNTASECGFTPQYAGLEKLYERFRDQGLTVLGFPCDQFGHQEPGDEAQISQFCSKNFGVTFPMFAKVRVNGAGADPLFQYLKSARRGFLWTRAIKWNFTKFLVDATGNVVKRYATYVKPNRLETDVSAAVRRAEP
jgi:glutathione peroxidase